eukprot:PhF_6_TR15480/c0_g1_i2/m.24076
MDPTHPIRIASWNVLHQKPFEKYTTHPTAKSLTTTDLSDASRRNRFYQTIIRDGSDVDVFAFQELSPQWLGSSDLLAEFVGFQQGSNALLVRRSILDETVPIVARGVAFTKDRGVGKITELLPVVAEEALGGREGSVSNGFVCATIPLKKGKFVTVCSTHLPFMIPPSKAKTFMAEGFWAALQKGSSRPFPSTPLICTGDYNMNLNKSDFRELLLAVNDAGPGSTLLQFPTKGGEEVYTARNVNKGNADIIDHAIVAGCSVAEGSVEVLPGHLHELLPSSHEDVLPWL